MGGIANEWSGGCHAWWAGRMDSGRKSIVMDRANVLRRLGKSKTHVMREGKTGTDPEGKTGTPGFSIRRLDGHFRGGTATAKTALNACCPLGLDNYIDPSLMTFTGQFQGWWESLKE